MPKVCHNRDGRGSFAPVSPPGAPQHCSKSKPVGCVKSGFGKTPVGGAKKCWRLPGGLCDGGGTASEVVIDAGLRSKKVHFMPMSVEPNLEISGCDLLRNPRIELDLGAKHEKGRFRASRIEKVQDLRGRLGVGTVVESKGDPGGVALTGQPARSFLGQ